jgi:hypothetical protein
MVALNTESLHRDIFASQFFDRQGRCILAGDWQDKFEDWEYKCVARTRVGDKTVSTVWLGLDHQFGGGPPLIFETMVFADDAGFEESECWRYTTEAEAVVGHNRVVMALQEGREP